MRLPVEQFCLSCAEELGRPSCERCGPGAPGRAPIWQGVELAPGTILHDQYLIGRMLASGSFAITYLAVDLQLRCRVAIKEHCPRELARRSDDKRRIIAQTEQLDFEFAHAMEKFRQEARLLASLPVHDNVVGVKNYFEANGTGYLVMDFVDHRSLEDLWRSYTEGAHLPAEDIWSVMKQVLKGLAWLHRHQVLHRDVKPSNICVSVDGRTRLIDFGAARFASGSHTQVWTPGFAPLEQMGTLSEQGPYTDVYGAAATAYFLFSDAIPIPASDRAAGSVLPHLREAAKVPISTALAEVIMRGLSLRPGDRYPDAEAFARAIDTAERAPVPREPPRAPAPAIAPAPPRAAPGGTRIVSRSGSRPVPSPPTKRAPLRPPAAPPRVVRRLPAAIAVLAAISAAIFLLSGSGGSEHRLRGCWRAVAPASVRGGLERSPTPEQRKLAQLAFEEHLRACFSEDRTRLETSTRRIELSSQLREDSGGRASIVVERDGRKMLLQGWVDGDRLLLMQESLGREAAYVWLSREP